MNSYTREKTFKQKGKIKILIQVLKRVVGTDFNKKIEKCAIQG